MTTNRTPPPETDRRILRFRPRGPRPSGGAGSTSWPPAAVDDLRKFEPAEDGKDYRHRMVTNALGFAFTVALVAGGIWIANTLADIRKNQDCYLSGQRRCTPISTPPMERY